MKRQPLVSVIIPVYNNAEYLGDAIGSVLKQTYHNFELLIVNDSSPDNASQVIKSFADSRIKYIEHEVNKGLSAARNTGVRSSQGEYVALLDGDDFFHQDKLKAHVDYFAKHPDVDVAYNARFELNHSSTTVRELWRPPLTVGLADFILGYPFSPSDMVLKRECLFKVNFFDESYTYYGEDMDINCKLALEGYKFASVDRALNYRRYHSRRVIKNLPSYKEDEFRPLYNTFADERFPPNLSRLMNISLSNRYLGWAIFSFLQEDTALGQEYCLEAVKLNPSLLAGRPSNLLQELIRYCIVDENRNHDELLERILQQLPGRLKWMADQGNWAITRGYFLRGVRAITWGRLNEGKDHFAEAVARGMTIDKSLLTQIASDLTGYEKEFGSDATFKVIRNLAPFINGIGNIAGIHWSEGFYLITRAHKSLNDGNYANIPSTIMRAITFQPSYLRDRGVMRMFVNSVTTALKDNGRASVT